MTTNNIILSQNYINDHTETESKDDSDFKQKSKLATITPTGFLALSTDLHIKLMLMVPRNTLINLVKIDSFREPNNICPENKFFKNRPLLIALIAIAKNNFKIPTDNFFTYPFLNLDKVEDIINSELLTEHELTQFFFDNYEHFSTQSYKKIQTHTAL